MGLNIKNAEAHKLAAELSQLTGMSMTAVVINALRKQLELLKRNQEKDTRVEELMAIGRRCAAHIDPSAKSIAHGDELYN